MHKVRHGSPQPSALGLDLMQAGHGVIMHPATAYIAYSMQTVSDFSMQSTYVRLGQDFLELCSHMQQRL